MNLTKTKLKQIIREEIGKALTEGSEELQSLAAKVRDIPSDPELQKLFKAKYARKANAATGKSLDDPWGSNWVNAVMTGGF